MDNKSDEHRITTQATIEANRKESYDKTKNLTE